MQWFVFMILMALVRSLTAALKRPREKPPRALCVDCAFVHMQYSASGRNAIFCTFGGGVREVSLTCSTVRITETATRHCG